MVTYATVIYSSIMIAFFTLFLLLPVESKADVVNLEWKKMIGYPNSAEKATGVSIYQNGIVVTGYVTNDFYTVVYDDQGNLIWKRSVDRGNMDRAYDVCLLPDNSIVVVGDSFGNSSMDFLIVKYDKYGNEIWKKVMDSGGDDAAYGVDCDHQGNLIITGVSDGNILTIKYDQNGHVIWSDEIVNGVGYGVAVDSEGNVIVVGKKEGDIFIVKYDSEGNKLWDRKVGDSDSTDIAYDVAVDSNDDIIVAGKINNLGCIVKLRADGDIVWIENGWSDFLAAKGVCVDNNDNIIVAGYYKPSSNCNFKVMKFDKHRNLIWETEFDSEKSDYIEDVAVNDNGDVVVVGGILKESRLLDFCVIKYKSLNSKPLPDFYFTSSLVETHQPVTFTGTVTDPDGTILSYHWNFGDGHTAEGQTVTHSYVTPGVYQVTLTVTDNDGASSSITKNITVLDVNPPNITDLTEQDICFTGDPFTFRAEVEDDGEIEKVDVIFWFGSGDTRVVQMSNPYGNIFEYSIIIPDTLDSLHYYFVARDSFNNEFTTSEKIIPVVDNDYPVITDVKANPNPQVMGKDLNISAKVIDNIAIKSVKLLIFYPDGTNQTYDLTGNRVEDVFYLERTYYLTGRYDFIIYAEDSSGNINYSDTVTFTIVDDTAPLIEDKTQSIAYTGNEFIFLAKVTDNQGIDRVYVEYWYGEGEHEIYEMMPLGDDLYTYTITVRDTLQKLHYEIFARDVSDNWNRTSTKEIEIIDDDLPIIEDLTPSSAGTGNIFTFKVRAQDNVGISDVALEYWYGNEEHLTANMIQTGSDIYVYTITVRDTLKSLHYFVTAIDTYGNQKILAQSIIEIYDDDTPIIHYINVEPSTQEIGGNVSITAKITDNIEIDGVFLYLTQPDGNVTRYKMRREGVIFSLKESFFVLGEFTFYIEAFDTSWNKVTSNTLVFHIVDTTPPTIEDLTQDKVSAGESLRFVAKVEDNVRVERVYVEYWYEGENEHKMDEMIKVLDFYEHYIVVKNTLIPLCYEIIARDSSNNWISTPVRKVSIIDISPACIENISINPSLQKVGYPVNISCEVKDDVLVENVTISINGPGGIDLEDKPMTSIKGGTYYFVYIPNITGNYNFTISVEDAAGNVNISPIYVFSVYGNRAPSVPHDPYPSDNQPNVGLNINLSWECEDPDKVDSLEFSVYFGTNPDPPFLANTTHRYFELEMLQPGTTYYWKIVVTDGSARVEGPIWRFTTISEEENTPPNRPEKPNGSTNAIVGVKYMYSTYTEDSDGNSIRYEFDWGDGNKSLTGWVNSGSRISVYHSWNKEGKYGVRVRAFDGISWSAWSEPLKVTVRYSFNPSNSPPDKAILVSGEGLVYVGRIYTYSIAFSDPDNDSLQIKVDWGDGTNSGWSGIVPSDKPVNFSHTWPKEGIYIVKAIARDQKNETSGWVDILTVHVISLLDIDEDGVPNDRDPLPRDPHNVENLLVEDKLLYLIKDQYNEIVGIYSPDHEVSSSVEKENKMILLDTDNDGRWEYVYDMLSGKVIPYTKSESVSWIYPILALSLVAIVGVLMYTKRLRSKRLIVKRFRCPECGFEIEMKGRKGQSLAMSCPKCSNKGLLKF